MRRVTLPGPLEIWAPSLFEAAVLHREIVAERTYERHGISIREGDTIFDVGANIGLFSLHVTQTTPGVRIHAFEPVPEIFQALTRNLTEHAARAVVHNVGLAEKSGEAVFEFDRFSTMAATMHPKIFDQGADRSASPMVWASSALADLEKVFPNRAWVRLARAGIETPGLRYGLLTALVPVMLALQLRRRAFLRKPRCRIQTLSEALSATGVDHVDLIKIDVEGAEESVLAGIAVDDWVRLRQFVIEVHDVEGRLDRMSALLESRGYRTVRAREDWAMHKLLGISTLYAIR